MNELRARTLMAQSRARHARADLVLDVSVAAREPVKVSATGLGESVTLDIVPKRVWWRTLGLHTHRIRRRAWDISAGRAARVRVLGLSSAYRLWAVIAFGLACAATYLSTR